jgi:hypothetical protein
MMKLLPLLLLLLLPAQSRALQQSNSNAPFGAYLGCFSLSRMLYMRGVKGKEGKQYSVDSIRQCMPDCRYSGYSMSIVTPDYRCWCAISTPDVQAQLEEAACAANSERGAAVFYHHECERRSWMVRTCTSCRESMADLSTIQQLQATKQQQ